MQTVVELISEMANDLKEHLDRLIRMHSSIVRWNYPNSSLIWVGGDYKWNDLDEKGRQVQSKTLEEYRRFSAIITTLAQGQPQKYLQTLNESELTLLRIIEQNETIYFKQPQEAYNEAIAALTAQEQVVANLYGDENQNPVFVPDTNALLFNPNLENWRFAEAKHFRLALTTSVLSELDQLKVNHRVEDVRQKAEGLISRIKGYRARGRITEGVTLVRDVSEIFALAVEPDLTKSLPWLDASNQDDRIIAAFIEVMRQNPRSPVILVTRDINLQNKLEFARLPFCEPPSL